MFRKFLAVVLLVGMVGSSSGCVAVLAGAGGATLWQGGKIVSEEAKSRDRSVRAVKAAFKSQKIVLTDELTKKNVTQLRGDDPSGTKFAVDIFETGEKMSRIEVRVGYGEKIPAREMLTAIKKRL